MYAHIQYVWKCMYVYKRISTMHVLNLYTFMYVYTFIVAGAVPLKRAPAAARKAVNLEDFEL